MGVKIDRSFCFWLPSQLHLQFFASYIISPGGGGGRATWVNFCWVCAAGLSEPLSHYSIVAYSEANYRPHLSHFWANMYFSRS